MAAGGRPSDRPGPGAAASLFLNNYRGGGIGDFGASVLAHLRAAGVAIADEETRPDGVGLSGQLRRLRSVPGTLITNVGLTAWGPSGLRNYRGFRSIGRRPRRGGPTIALVHHAIEMIDLAEAGYPVSRLVRWGAHRALAWLRECDIVVFSPRLGQLLRDGYGARSVWVTPIPSAAPRRMPERTGGWRVLNVGYFAPYKGIDEFLGVAELLRDRAEFSLVGRPHRVLSERAEFGAAVRTWTERAASARVAMPGFLPSDELDRLMSGRTIGVLPYTSSSGASASFGLFAERGVPVIASDLPEFRFLQECGAGIVLAPAHAKELATAVRGLLDDPSAWSELARRQAEFAKGHDWAGFVRELVARFPTLRPPNSAVPGAHPMDAHGLSLESPR